MTKTTYIHTPCWELDLYEKLHAAFEYSTSDNNLFHKAIKSVKWDSEFYADGEFYFCLGGFTFTTPSLDPNKVTPDWRPAGLFTDREQIEFRHVY